MVKNLSSKKIIRKNTDKRHENLIPAKKGEVRNPNGRPKGSRNKFGEAFFADLHAEWEKAGKEVLERVRIEDPSTFLRVAASLQPKEVNVNEGETALERILEQYSNEELDRLITGICALGVVEQSATRKNQEDIAERSHSVH